MAPWHQTEIVYFDASWAKKKHGNLRMCVPCGPIYIYIYINTYEFAVPPIFWSPETVSGKSETENAPRQIFKTIQKGRRQDSESVNY